MVTRFTYLIRHKYSRKVLTAVIAANEKGALQETRMDVNLSILDWESSEAIRSGCFEIEWLPEPVEPMLKQGYKWIKDGISKPKELREIEIFILFALQKYGIHDIRYRRTSDRLGDIDICYHTPDGLYREGHIVELAVRHLTDWQTNDKILEEAGCLEIKIRSGEEIWTDWATFRRECEKHSNTSIRRSMMWQIFAQFVIPNLRLQDYAKAEIAEAAKALVDMAGVDSLQRLKDLTDAESLLEGLAKLLRK